jgi:hypothetical protein
MNNLFSLQKCVVVSSPPSLIHSPDEEGRTDRTREDRGKRARFLNLTLRFFSVEDRETNLFGNLL